MNLKTLRKTICDIIQFKYTQTKNKDFENFGHDCFGHDHQLKKKKCII